METLAITATDDGSMEPQHVWQGKVNKQPITMLKIVGRCNFFLCTIK
jgi:hypothetical protein